MSRIRAVTTARFKNFMAFQRDPLAFFCRMHGEGEMLSLKTGFRPSYIVNGPEFLQEILLTKERSFRKGRTSEVLRRTIGDGLLTAEKQDHERQKRMMQPAFYKERLQHYAEIMVEETERWTEQALRKPFISLQDEMMQLTLSIITRAMFRTDVDEIKQRLAAAVSDTIEQTARSLFSPLPLPFALPTKGHRIHKKAVRDLEEMVYPVIEEAKRDPEGYRYTLPGMLLDAMQASGGAADETEVRDQMMTMLLAGHETTASLLTWIWYELGRNRPVEEQFHAEADAWSDEGQPAEAVRSLTYTNLIIQEGLRLYPPAWLIYRELAEPAELLGEPFKADSTFMICPYAIHRNPEVFPDPERFWPERFAEGAAAKMPKFAYFPFGGGSRSCIGSRFALMEAAIILAVAGRRLALRKADDTPVIPEPLVSLRVKNGIRMRVLSRQPN